MKTLIALLITLTAFVPFASAQLHDEEFSTEFVYLRRNIDIAVPAAETFRFEKLKDSVGFRIGYTHFLGRSGGRGNVGIGIEGGATLHDVDNSTVALGRAQFKLVLQANGAKRFQPFVKGTVGWSRDNFKNTVVRPSPGGGFSFSGPDTSETFGGGVGLDIPFKEGGRRKWRIGLEYFATSFAGGRQHNVEASFGLVL